MRRPTGNMGAGAFPPRPNADDEAGAGLLKLLVEPALGDRSCLNPLYQGAGVGWPDRDAHRIVQVFRVDGPAGIGPSCHPVPRPASRLSGLFQQSFAARRRDNARAGPRGVIGNHTDYNARDRNRGVSRPCRPADIFACAAQAGRPPAASHRRRPSRVDACRHAGVCNRRRFFPPRPAALTLADSDRPRGRPGAAARRSSWRRRWR
jgi:hypothetical protein